MSRGPVIRLNRKQYDAVMKKLLSKLQDKDDRFSKGLANIVIKGIVNRTQRGINVAGARFKPYSPKYAAKKRNMGMSSIPNLVLSGKMISEWGFDYEVLSGNGKIYIRIFIPKNKSHSGYGRSNISHYTLAAVHNFGQRSGRGQGFQMPKREFMGLDKEIIGELNKYSKEHWRKLLYALNRGQLNVDTIDALKPLYA